MARDGSIAAASHAANNFVSYSLNFEDVMLHRLLARFGPGSYVDVGAGHPRVNNDTYALYQAGWRGVNVEPDEAFFCALEENRPDDRNLCVALSDEVGSEIVYHDIPSAGLSTSDATLARSHELSGCKVRLRQVPVSTLAVVLEEIGASAVDVLRVNVEGMEEKVLVGNDWQRFRPKVVLVDATYPETPERRPTGVGALLEAHGYRHAHFDGRNDFYLEQSFDDQGAFALPPNVFDGFILREIVDLRAALNSLNAGIRSAQADAVSLEESRRLSTARVCELEADKRHLELDLDDRRVENCRLRSAIEQMQAEILTLSRALEPMHRVNEELASLRLHFSGLIANECQRADAERQRADAERQRADAERQRADAERQRADAERQRADTVQQRADTERQRADSERQRADSERQRADSERQRADTVQQRAERLGQYIGILHTSSSWKLTWPWRACGRLLKREHGGDWHEL